jgi:hypothetical protein
MHIPKCGGIAVERAIERAAGGSLAVCPLYMPAELDAKAYGDLPGYDFYKGHFKYNFLASLPADYLRTVVVRRPLDQLLSLCNHIAGRPEHAMHEAVQGMTLAQLLRHSSGNHNLLSKYVLGSARFREICFQRRRSRAERVAMAVAEAHRNLTAVDVIGVTSRLAAFVAEVGRRTGIAVAAPRRENANKVTTYRREELSDDDAAALQDASWVDRPVFQMIWREFIAP